MKVSRIFPYTPPTWWPGQKEFFPKSGRLSLGNLPTPLHSLGLTNLCDVNGISFNMFVKRDDMSGGVEMGGNKIRKLNFLLADALAGGYDSVVTIGGEQSNHCRATAAAARMVGLDPHLILRTRKSYVDDNEMLGTTGNLLYDRFVGATIYTCTPGEYGRVGSNALLKKVCGDLQRMGKVPYLINVGGSNGIGTWGYIDAIDELVSQITSYSQNVGEDSTNESLINIDHIVFACGSGGTAAGISCGVALAFSNERNLHLPQVHAIGVCDSPEYFYNEILNISREELIFSVYSFELHLIEYDSLIYQNDTIFVGSLLNAIFLLNNLNPEMSIIEFLERIGKSSLKFRNLKEILILNKILLILNQNGKRKLTSLKKKYNHKKYKEVAETTFLFYFKGY